MTKATLGGKLLLASSSVSWSFVEGAKPYLAEIDMDPADARALMGGSGSTSFLREGLRIEPEQGNPVKADALFLLAILPGPNKFLSKVQVADRRAFWSYTHILRRYNVRRNVGTKRLVANDQVPAVNPIGDLVAYWRWSVKDNAKPWTAIEMVKDVLDVVAEADSDYTGSKPQVIVDPALESSTKNVPIEDLIIDEPADAAIMRAISYLPEAGIYVDAEGNYNVFSKTDGKDKDVVKALIPEIDRMGHADLVKNDNIRPKEIDVLFTREVEVRFDFTESASAGDTVAELGDARRMDNVLSLPDYQLTIAGSPMCQGTWVTFTQAMNAWGSLPSIAVNGAGRSMNYDLLLRAFIPGMDLWAALRLAGSQPDNNGVIKPWMERIAACQTHFRQTFRINSRWTDRFLSLRAYRVATIDPTSGQRGPSCAYGDYSILYTQQTLLKQVRTANSSDGSPDWIMNKTAYPANGTLDSTAVPSPGVVTVLDADQGIIRVTYRPNPIFGMNETILPSQVQLGTMPTADITNRTRPLTFDSVTNSRQAPKLSPSFKMATVLSAVPASPNSKQQLHKITIKPSDIEEMVGGNVGPCNGPPMEIRIGPQLEVARVAWNDQRAADIEKIFGLTEGEPMLKGLVINEDDPGGLTNGASLNAIAKAEAARVYAALGDRPEGTATGYMNGRIFPAGHTPEIAHNLSPDGTATTAVKLPAKIPQLSLFSFLDSNSRQAILKLVQPQ